MTINNLYLKVSKKENWSIVNPVKKNDETTPPLSQNDFDTQSNVEQTAL